jgi:hypothetical protein
MSIDFEDQLRTDMGRVQVHPRPGLAREAHRRYARSRRRTALAVAATGTAAAVAGVTAGFALAAGPPGVGVGAGGVETTAYVVNRVSTALSATDAIGYSVSRYTGPGVSGGLNNPQLLWEYEGQFRALTETPAGRPYTDVSALTSGDKWLLTTVNYSDRDWWRAIVPDGQQYLPGVTGDRLCGGTAPSLFGAAGTTAADWKKSILIGLQCRAFTAAGRQRVGGVDAIRLAGQKTLAGTTIWVDPHSYLPVRMTVPEQVVTGARGTMSSMTMHVDFRWLPPTSANLAQLTTTPIPSGFRHMAGNGFAVTAVPTPKTPVSG